MADQVVVVTTPSADAVDSARLALARSARDSASLSPPIFAIVSRRRLRRSVLHRLQTQLDAGLARAVLVPHDRDLASVGRIATDMLRPQTRHAYMTLAALVAGPTDR